MSEDAAHYSFDRTSLRQSHARAARSFDAAAVLHADVRAELLARLDLVALSPEIILDAGCATGNACAALIRRYRKAQVIGLDFSAPMLRVAATRSSWLRSFQLVCADAESLPLKSASVDLILSNLMLQWCNPDAVFAEFKRVLKPGGLLSFTTLGPDTLKELRSAWREADTGVHVSQFLDMHDLGDALVRAGFDAPVLDVERLTLSYNDVRALSTDLKDAGAQNKLSARSKGLTGRHKFAAMQSSYERYRIDGRLPATYEVVYAHAWAPAPRARNEDTNVPLEEIKRQLRLRRG